jgi:acyl-CoA thioester hydrolase
MIRAVTKVRVRYGETDQMGYAYYGVYAQYYEIGRVEAMRTLGLSYKEVEAKGINMPVADFAISYKRPAFYDDEVTITTTIKEMPSGVRLRFDYECHNESGELLNTGHVTLVCVDRQSGKMGRIPEWFLTAMAPFFAS